MKTLLLTLLLIACGDNIHPPVAVDAGHPAVPADDWPVAELEPDAGVDGTDAPVCDDKHIDINDHEHKCQH